MKIDCLGHSMFDFRSALSIIVAVAIATCICPNAWADGCPANAQPSYTEHTPGGDVVHCECIAGYVAGDNGCEPEAAPQPSQPPSPADSALASQICATRTLIADDQQAIKALNFVLTAKDFNEIASLTKDRRDELQNKAIDSMFGAVLNEASARAVLKTASLNPFNAQKYIGQLKKIGVQSTLLNGAIRNMALVRGKAQIAQAFNKFAGVAKSTYDGYEARDKGTANALAVVSIGIVSALREQPELGAIATETDLLIALAYSGQLQTGIDQLNSMGDANLLTLDRLTKRLRDHVDQLNDLKHSWSDQFPGSSLPCSTEPVA